MTVYSYDGSFDGFLSVVFEAYRRGEVPAAIAVGDAAQAGLFGGVVEVEADEQHAERVRRGLRRRASAEAVETFYHALLSERPEIEMTLFRLVHAVIERGGSVMEDLRFPPALATLRLAGRTRRERHRMHAFVRFERRAGDLWAAPVEPDCNVLPLIGDHFAQRYPAQRWLITDVRRRYGLLHAPAPEGDSLPPAARLSFLPGPDLPAAADEEARFQRMWQAYFRAVDIPERKNLKLHLRHVPRRYWPYLTEKRGG